MCTQILPRENLVPVSYEIFQCLCLWGDIFIPPQNPGIPAGENFLPRENCDSPAGKSKFSRGNIGKDGPKLPIAVLATYRQGSDKASKGEAPGLLII